MKSSLGARFHLISEVVLFNSNEAKHLIMMLKSLILAALLPAAAQFGRKKEVNAPGSLGDLGEAAGHSSGLSDVDLASNIRPCFLNLSSVRVCVH